MQSERVPVAVVAVFEIPSPTAREFHFNAVGLSRYPHMRFAIVNTRDQSFSITVAHLHLALVVILVHLRITIISLPLDTLRARCSLLFRGGWCQAVDLLRQTRRGR